MMQIFADTNNQIKMFYDTSKLLRVSRFDFIRGHVSNFD